MKGAGETLVGAPSVSFTWSSNAGAVSLRLLTPAYGGIYLFNSSQSTSGSGSVKWTGWANTEGCSLYEVDVGSLTAVTLSFSWVETYEVQKPIF